MEQIQIKVYTYKQLLSLPPNTFNNINSFVLMDEEHELIPNQKNKKYSFLYVNDVAQASTNVEIKNGKVEFKVMDSDDDETEYGKELTKRYNEKKEEEKRQREAPKVVPVVAVVPKKETPKPVKKGFVRIKDLKDDEENKILKPILSEIVDVDGEITEQHYRIALELLSDERFLTISDEAEKWDFLTAIEEEIEKREQEVLKQSPPEGSQPFQNLDSDVFTNALLLKLLAPLSKDGFIEKKYIDPAFRLLSDKYEDLNNIKDIKNITEDNISKFVNDLQTQILNQEIVVPRLNEDASNELETIQLKLQESAKTIRQKQEERITEVFLEQLNDKIPFIYIKDDLKGYIPLDFLENIKGIYYISKKIVEEADKLKNQGFKDWDETNKFREGLYSKIATEVIASEIIRRKYREQLFAVKLEEKIQLTQEEVDRYTPEMLSQISNLNKYYVEILNKEEVELLQKELTEENRNKLIIKECNPSTEELKEEKNQNGKGIVPSLYPKIIRDDEELSCVSCYTVSSETSGLYKLHDIHEYQNVKCARCIIKEFTARDKFLQNNQIRKIHKKCDLCNQQHEGRLITDYQVYCILRKDTDFLNSNPNFYTRINENLRAKIEDAKRNLDNFYKEFSATKNIEEGKAYFTKLDTEINSFLPFRDKIFELSKKEGNLRQDDIFEIEQNLTNILNKYELLIKYLPTDYQLRSRNGIDNLRKQFETIKKEMKDKYEEPYIQIQNEGDKQLKLLEKEIEDVKENYSTQIQNIKSRLQKGLDKAQTNEEKNSFRTKALQNIQTIKSRRDWSSRIPKEAKDKIAELEERKKQIPLEVEERVKKIVNNPDPSYEQDLRLYIRQLANKIFKRETVPVLNNEGNPVREEEKITRGIDLEIFNQLISKHSSLIQAQNLEDQININIKERSSEILWKKYQEIIQLTMEQFLESSREKLKTDKKKRNAKLNINIQGTKEQFTRNLSSFKQQKQLNAEKKARAKYYSEKTEELEQKLKQIQKKITDKKAEIDAIIISDTNKKKALKNQEDSVLYDQVKAQKNTMRQQPDVKFWSMCPYCLEFNARASGCMWLAHFGDCLQGDFPCKVLRQKYIVGKNEWCVACSCPASHAHIKKYSKEKYTVGSELPALGHFDKEAKDEWGRPRGLLSTEENCVKNMGFGKKEFIARRIGMREAIRDLLQKGVTEKSEESIKKITLAAENAAIHINIYLINHDRRFNQNTFQYIQGVNVQLTFDRRNELESFKGIMNPLPNQFLSSRIPPTEEEVIKEREKEAERIGKLMDRVFAGEAIEDVIPIDFSFIANPLIKQIEGEITQLEADQQKITSEIDKLQNEKLAPVQKVQPVAQQVAAVAGFTRLSDEELRKLLIQTESEIQVASDEDIPILFTKIEDIRAEIEKRRPNQRQGVLNLFKNRYGHYTNPGPQRGGGGNLMNILARTEFPENLIEESAETCALPTSNKIPSVGGKKNKTLKRKNKKSK